MSCDLRIISLGAGVQSTTLYLMACHGEIGPLPQAAIFADVGDEAYWTYEYLAQLEKRWGKTIPVRHVSVGTISKDWFDGRKGVNGERVMPASPPFFIRNNDGSDGMVRRMCTLEYKIDPIVKETRAMLGLKRGERAMGRFQVEQWIGISRDEAHRMKDNKNRWIKNRYPLIDAGMSRVDCRAWLKEKGYEQPRRSSCVYCPYHSDTEWRELMADPQTREQIVTFDRKLRSQKSFIRPGAKTSGLKGVPFLHRTRKPIEDIDFTDNQLGLWGEDCEGMCGL